MATLITTWRAVRLFYRSVAPAMLSVSGLLILVVQLPGLQEGWGTGALPRLLLAKLLTAPAVWYLAEQLRPHQYWFYYNLGVARWQLWAGVIGLDGALFLTIAGLLTVLVGKMMPLASPARPRVLEADGIRVAFAGRVVLSSIYLRVEAGQVVGLLGRNGSGKSTLLQTVFGARAVPDASVRADGRRVVPAFQTPGLLNYLPQAPLLPPYLPLRQAARLLRVDADQALASFPELRPQLDRRVGELSGGTARLLQTLLLLHADTAFSLFDEPFTGVMPVHADALARELRRATQRKGVLLTDHRHADVLPLCDVLYLLHQGCLRRLGPNPHAELLDYGYLAR